MDCDRCHKSLEGGTKVSGVVGIKIILRGTDHKQESGYLSIEQPDDDFLQLQLGKYELNKEYNFCYECLLDALFQTRGESAHKRMSL